MPPKHRKHAKGKRTKGKRRARITTVQPSTQPIANRLITKLKYVDTVTIPLNIDGVGVWEFRLNSLYDPDFSGGGHQPYGYDQLTTLYQQYRVFGARIKFTILDVLDDSSNLGIYMGIYNTPNANILAGKTTSEILELPYCKYKVTSATTAAGGISRTMYQRVNIPRVMGVRSAQYKSDDLYMSAVGGNPASQLFGNFFVADPTLAVASKEVKVGVQIIYYAEMLYPVTLNQS